jgi:ZIP family zinc transporter
MVLDWLISLNPILQALVATLFTWFVTAAGAALVFFFKSINRKILNGMLGFASGVMIAASFWSLLKPATEMADEMSKITGIPFWIPPVIGFLAGGGFLWIVDRILPHLHTGMKLEESEGIKTSWQRSILLVLAITIHNIPEGLAVGVAFGALAVGKSGATFGAAVALAIGIGLQNFPEGTAVSVPLRREGLSRLRSFWYGQLSGIVEPLAGVLGAAAVIAVEPLLPFALAFAAGAMIYVVIEELIPESQIERESDIATVGGMLGFAVMMTMDIALG